MRASVSVNNEILTWAINRAGYDLPSFAEEFPRIQTWLTGEKQPTVKQLEDFSRKVYLPFGYLFLDKPPVEKLLIPYYRSNGTTVEKININVYDTILLIQRRQNWLKEYLKENNFEKLPFVGRYEHSEDTLSIVRDIRAELNLPKSWAQGFGTWRDALNHLVGVLEDKGVIVVFNGVVGNNTSRKIPVTECRGFVLVDEMAPFMFINNNDFKSAQMFTIVHELAHIWTGNSAGFDFRTLQPAEEPIEKLCDRVAAEFLVPESVFHNVWDSNPDTRNAARQFKVSEIVIARRALDTGKWTKDQFFKFYEDYRKREFSKKDAQSSGGDFYATVRKRISSTFASHVHQAVRADQLLYRDAYKLTGLKGDTFKKFVNQLT